MEDSIMRQWGVIKKIHFAMAASVTMFLGLCLFVLKDRVVSPNSEITYAGLFGIVPVLTR
jgi:hypothetical protein